MTSYFYSLRSSRSSWTLFTALVLLLAAVAFASLRHHGLDTHDEETFQDNTALDHDFSHFFQPPEDRGLASGRPFAELLKFLAYLLIGNDPSSFHLLVVASHTLASLLLAVMVIRLGLAPVVGFSAALLFLYNVAHFQAVQWISALDYSLSLSWAIAAVLCWLRHVEGSRNVWLCAFWGCMALSICSHPSGLAALPFCAYWSWHTHADQWRRHVGELVIVALFLLPVLFYAIDSTERATSTWNSIHLHQERSIQDLLKGHLRMLLWFAGRLFTTAHWLPLPVYRTQTWELAAGAVALLLMGLLAWRQPRGSGLGAIWSVLFLIPYAMLTEDLVLDMPAGSWASSTLWLGVGPSRYLYLSSAGSSLILACLLHRAAEFLAARSAPLGAGFHAGCLVLVLAFSAFTLKRAEAFSFYTSGRYYLTTGDPDTGIDQFRRALDTGGSLIDAHEAYARMGLVLLSRPEAAKALVHEGLAQFPESATLGLFKLVLDSMYRDEATRERALTQLQSLMNNQDVRSIVGQCYFNLGSGLADAEDHAKAAEALLLSQQFLPNRPQTLRKLAFSLFTVGRREEAIALLERAIQIDNSPRSHYALGVLLKLQGETERAMRTFEQVVEMAPGSDAANQARRILDAQ